MLKRTKIAASGTVIALGALSAIAVGASGDSPSASNSETAAPPIVKTVVVHRTIKVVKREKPKASTVDHDSPAASPPAPAHSAPAIQDAEVHPAPTSPPKLQTTTSGSDDDHESDDREDEREDHENENVNEDEREFEDGDDD